VPQDLFSSPPGDDEEPDSSPLPSAAEEEDDPGFTGQGLYVSRRHKTVIRNEDLFMHLLAVPPRPGPGKPAQGWTR
jgi:hypothetical protein